MEVADMTRVQKTQNTLIQESSATIQQGEGKHIQLQVSTTISDLLVKEKCLSALKKKYDYNN